MARTGKLTSLVTDEDIKLSQRRSLSTETADKLTSRESRVQAF